MDTKSSFVIEVFPASKHTWYLAPLLGRKKNKLSVEGWAGLRPENDLVPEIFGARSLECTSNLPSQQQLCADMLRQSPSALFSLMAPNTQNVAFRPKCCSTNKTRIHTSTLVLKH